MGDKGHAQVAVGLEDDDYEDEEAEVYEDDYRDDDELDDDAYTTPREIP